MVLVSFNVVTEMRGYSFISANLLIRYVYKRFFFCCEYFLYFETIFLIILQEQEISFSDEVEFSVVEVCDSFMLN